MTAPLADRTEPVLQALRVARAYLLSQRDPVAGRHAASVTVAISTIEALTQHVVDLDRIFNAPSKVSA